MNLYTIIITIVAVICFVNSLKWKIATRAIILFCKENYREPTDKEIADCTKRTADNTLKFK